MPRADSGADVRARQRAFVQRHSSFVSRVLWSQGVPRAAIDDAAQQVFIVALRQLDELRDERSFLFTVASRTAKAARRAEQRTPPADDAGAADSLVDSEPRPDELLGKKRARELLDEILASLPEDARTVFVLFEVEGLTMKDIAAALDVAPGTVASRLRRGRELFQAAARRVRAREQGGVA